jgi:hypothetical protein
MIKFNRFIILSLFAMLIVSCADSDFESTTFPENAFEVKGAVVSVADVVTGFYNLQDPATASIGFTVDTKGETVNSVDIFKSYNGSEPVLFRTVTDLPGTLTVPLADAADGLVSVDDLEVADFFTFTFAATTPSGTFPSGSSLQVDVSCPSDIAGTYTFVSTNLAADNSPYDCPNGEVTGEVTFTDLGGGQYLVSDLGFGQYESTCWSDGPATSDAAIITDLCNQIFSGGLDQYSLVYTWVITDVSGPDLSISWSNDYADRGDVVVTRPDGSDWPALFTN